MKPQVLLPLGCPSPFTVIRFVRVSTKFGTCTVVSVNGTLVKPKYAHSPLNVRILSSTRVPLTLTSVQVPNLALVGTKWITVFTAHTVCCLITEEAT
jgi:hypothetical protein